MYTAPGQGKSASREKTVSPAFVGLGVHTPD